MMQRIWKCSKGGPFRAEFKVHKAPGDVGGNDKTLSFFELNKEKKKNNPPHCSVFQKRPEVTMRFKTGAALLIYSLNGGNLAI